MGQKQGGSKYEDDDEDEDEEKYTNKKSNDTPKDIEEKYKEINTPEDIEGKYKEIKEELNNLQLPFEKFKENYDFYKKNYEQLKKVNEIINNIKVANLYEETTFNVLKQIVEEESMKILPPDYSEQYKTVKQVMLLNAPLKPIYAKLNKWEDLFNLELPDDIIDKLNIYVKEKKKKL
jgi:hypothetical protein